jgi:hypothetical protein
VDIRVEVLAIGSLIIGSARRALVEPGSIGDNTRTG